jgi:hypothetical protein
MAATVPDVEIADHRHAPGIRRPHGETHAIDAIDVVSWAPRQLLRSR